VLRAPAAVLVGALLALGSAAPVEAVTGEQRVLAVLATWGPTPFQAEDVRRVIFAEADAFLRRSSYGKVHLRGEVTSWLRVLPQTTGCSDEWWEVGIPTSVSGPARAAAAGRGFRLADYHRFVYIVPGSRCAFLGMGWETEVLLNGSLSPLLVVHELGHTWGLGHAGSARCADICSLDDQGDPYSPMGRGAVDFSIYEKVMLGWTRNVAAASRAGTTRIGRADRAGPRPLALRIDTALGAYWLEYRPQPLDMGFRGTAPGGIVLRYVNAQRDEGPFENMPVLIDSPSGRGRPTVTVGEDVRVPGVFAARFVKRAGADAVLRFRWTDGTAPRPPEIVSPRDFGAVGSTVRVRWEVPFERGSGVVSYRVVVDGGKPTVVKTEELLLTGLSSGAHFVSVWAVDRAGNRGLAAVRRFDVA
jgi:hypothetical protein